MGSFGVTFPHTAAIRKTRPIRVDQIFTSPPAQWPRPPHPTPNTSAEIPRGLFPSILIADPVKIH